MRDAGIVELGQQDDALILREERVGELLGVGARPQGSVGQGFLAHECHVVLHRGEGVCEMGAEIVVGGRQFGGEVAEGAAHRPAELRFERGLDDADGVGNGVQLFGGRRGGGAGQLTLKGLGV